MANEKISRYPQPNRRYAHLYPVVRIDTPVNNERPENSVTAVKTYESEEQADVEAKRLNVLKADKSCHYFTCVTRLVPKEGDVA